MGTALLISGVWRLGLKVLAVVLLMLVALIMAAAAALASVFGWMSGDAVTVEPSQRTETAVGDIPPAYLAAYQDAGDRYGIAWQVIAAIGYVESRHDGYGSTSTGCIEGPPTRYGTAKGPMQFLDSTWASYAVDGNGDGRKDVCDYRDAVPAAAVYLRASGAPAEYRAAIYNYNRAGWYVDMVLSAAYSYGWKSGVPSGECEPPAALPAPPAVGSRYAVSDRARRLPAGVPEIMDRVFAGRQFPVSQGYGPSPLALEPSYAGYPDFHRGVDFPMPEGTPLYAPADGVAESKLYSGSIKVVTVRLRSGYTWNLLHLSEQLADGPVTQGQLIGLSGNSGYPAYSTGPHLHLELRAPTGDPVPPEQWACEVAGAEEYGG